MKRNGFTLVELLTTISIMVIIMGLATSAYFFLQKNMNQTMYENKVRLALTAAENWAQEANQEITNIGHLIEEGKLEADNESGDYKNPVDKESMLCDVVKIRKENNQWVAEITGEKNCDYDDLLSQTSIITMKKYKEDGSELGEDEWYRGNVTLKVLLKDQSRKNDIKSLKFSGNNEEDTRNINGDFDSKNTYVVTARQLINAKYEARIELQETDFVKEHKASTTVKIDQQRPTIYFEDLTIDQENTWVSHKKRITFVMSDMSGSGIAGYTVSTNSRCGSASIIRTNESKVTTDPLNQGTYYLCAIDKVGNWSEENSSKRFEISKIDTTNPNIQGLTITSTTPNYHHYNTDLTIKATDESPLSMYISNTGYEQNGTWEKYSETKRWAVGNSLNGKTVTVYVTIRDEAGNKSNVSANYTLYKECVNYNTTYGEWGACSASCDGGTQERTYERRDVTTNAMCPSGSERRACNTQPCFDPGNPSYDDLLDCSKVEQVFGNAQGLKKVLENEAMRKRVRNLSCTPGYGKIIYDTCVNNEDVFNVASATTNVANRSYKDGDNRNYEIYYQYSYYSDYSKMPSISRSGKSEPTTTISGTPQNNPLVYIMTDVYCGTGWGFSFEMYYGDDLNIRSGRYYEKLTHFYTAWCSGGSTTNIYMPLFGGGGTYYGGSTSGRVAATVCSPIVEGYEPKKDDDEEYSGPPKL